jgi:hypothetical protein
MTHAPSDEELNMLVAELRGWSDGKDSSDDTKRKHYLMRIAADRIEDLCRLTYPSPSATDAMRAATIEECAKIAEQTECRSSVHIHIASRIRDLSPAESRTSGEAIDYCDCGTFSGSHCRPKFCQRKPTPQPAGDAKAECPVTWKREPPKGALWVYHKNGGCHPVEGFEPELIAEIERLRAAPPSTDAMRRALEAARSVIDNRMGDTDIEGDDSPEMEAMRLINAAITPPSTEKEG